MKHYYLDKLYSILIHNLIYINTDNLESKVKFKTNIKPNHFLAFNFSSSSLNFSIFTKIGGLSAGLAQMQIVAKIVQINSIQGKTLYS